MTESKISARCLGILAYGSLVRDPGTEIGLLLIGRILTTTPFRVEYGRLSASRGGAPTVVPHSAGTIVNAEILVLGESASLDEAKNVLWRRETRNENSSQTYKENPSANAVVIRDEVGFCGLDHVLYTDFNASGKLENPNPNELARAAIASVAKAPRGKDGISYLMDLVNGGVETALKKPYIVSILAITGAASLASALAGTISNVEKGPQNGKS